MSLLRLDSLDIFYGPAQALWGVSFAVEEGQVASLIGANGAGKTTTLKALCGLIPLAAGGITYDGKVISGQPVHRIMDLGISLVPEGRQLFPKMTVEENLTIGSYLPRTKPGAPPTWSRSITSSPVWRSAADRWRRPCPVASSRCWRSAGL